MLERIAALPAGLDVLLTLALALSDYQLGPGGATVYWAEADRLLDGHAVESSDDMLPFMEALMTRPVAARLAQAKVDRVGRLLASNIPGQVADGVAAVDAGALWENLANALGGDRNAKTIVFALKTLGLLHLRATGRRMRLPDELPIPVDLRIARVSLSAGLIAPPAGVDVVAAMENVGQIAADMRGPIIDAWREVAQHIGLTAPEFDSLLWQIAVPLHSHRRSRPESTRAVSALLEQRGAESAGAQRVADELTWGLATQAAPRSESSVSGD